MGGIEYHPNKRWKSYTYAGRFAYVSPTGTAAGYGSRLANNGGLWIVSHRELTLPVCSISEPELDIYRCQ